MQRSALVVALGMVAAPAHADRPSVGREARWLGVAALAGAGLLGAGGGVALATRFDDGATLGYVPAMATGGGVVGIALGAAALDGLAAIWPGRARDRGRLTLALGHRWVHVPGVLTGHGAAAAIELDTTRVTAALTADAAGAYRYLGLDGAFVVPIGRWRLGAGALVEASRVDRVAPIAAPVAGFAVVARELDDVLPHAARPRARIDLGAGAFATDGRPLLIARARISAWVGATEVTLDYDHRKDGVPGGLYVGKAPGFLGSAGVALRRPIGRFAIRAGGRLGTGWTTWLGLDASL